MTPMTGQDGTTGVRAGADKARQTSFPFYAIAREHGVDYGDVLRMADAMEKEMDVPVDKPVYLPIWIDSKLKLAVFHAIMVERIRRAEIG